MLTLTEIALAIAEIETALAGNTSALKRVEQLRAEFAALHVEILERDAKIREFQRGRE